MIDDRAVCFEQVHLRVFAHRQLDAPDTTEQCKQRQETDHCRVARCQFEIWVNQIKDNLKEESCKFCCAESGVLCEPDHGWLNLSCLSVEHLPFAWQWPLSLRQVIAKKTDADYFCKARQAMLNQFQEMHFQVGKHLKTNWLKHNCSKRSLFNSFLSTISCQIMHRWPDVKSK